MSLIGLINSFRLSPSQLYGLIPSVYASVGGCDSLEIRKPLVARFPRAASGSDDTTVALKGIRLVRHLIPAVGSVFWDGWNFHLERPRGRDRLKMHRLGAQSLDSSVHRLEPPDEPFQFTRRLERSLVTLFNG